MTETLSALDATFLELEQHDEGALMHIGGVMVFEPLPGGGVPIREEIAVSVAARLHSLPRYTQRLSSPRTGRLAWPHWEPYDAFDIFDHVTHVALPAPGSDDQLWEWAADYYSHRLDRMRPLWEMALVTGLAQGRWAVGWKTHHCMIDGVGSVDVVHLLLDNDPAGWEGTGQQSAPQPVDSAAIWRSLLGELHPPEPLVQAAGAGLHALGTGMHAVRHPQAALSASRALAEFLVRDEVIAAPRTSLNVPIGATRRFAAVHADLAGLKSVCRTFGGSVNDVVLAGCAAGLARLLTARGESLPPRGIRAMVPMNLRTAAQRLALGNRVTSLFVDLPVAEPDPLSRYLRVVDATNQLKASGAERAANTVLDLATLAPPMLHAILARSTYATRLFNVTVTNVPGPQMPLYALGSRLQEILPIVPLAAAHTVGVAVFSYHGRLTFGVIADRASTPDLDVLASGIADGLAELLAQVPVSPDPENRPSPQASPA